MPALEHVKELIESALPGSEVEIVDFAGGGGDHLTARVSAPQFAGLSLIPLGIWRKKKREGRSGIKAQVGPISWENYEFRKLVYFVGATTVVNIVIASQLSYGAVNSILGGPDTLEWG